MPRFAVHGTAGSWVKHGLDVQEGQLKAGITPASTDWGKDPLPAHLYQGDATVASESMPAGQYPAFYACVHDAICCGGANPVPAVQAIGTMAVLETVVEAARRGRMMPLALSATECAAWSRGTRG